MTYQEIDAALRSQEPPIGWEQSQSRAMFDPPTVYCNRDMCRVYANAAALAGSTATELADAVGSQLAGDGAPLAEIFSTGEAFAAELAKVGIAWMVEATGAAWARDPSVRPTVQTALVFDGAPVSPAEYYAAGDAAGATATDLADALRELVDGDPSMFDAIMSSV